MQDSIGTASPFCVSRADVTTKSTYLFMQNTNYCSPVTMEAPLERLARPSPPAQTSRNGLRRCSEASSTTSTGLFSLVIPPEAFDRARGPHAAPPGGVGRDRPDQNLSDRRGLWRRRAQHPD